MQSTIQDILNSTSLDHAERDAIASCVLSCSQLPAHLRKRLEAHDGKPGDMPVSQRIDSLAVAAFAPAIAALLAAVPNSHRNNTRRYVFEQLEELQLQIGRGIAALKAPQCP